MQSNDQPLVGTSERLFRTGLSYRFRVTNSWFGFLCLVPALLVLGAVVAVPLGRTILISFQYYSLLDLAGSGRFVGLSNFLRVLGDSAFWTSVYRTATFVFFSLAGQFVIGFFLALLLNQQIRGRSWIRGAFLLPWILPSAETTLLWMWMANPQYGIVNWILQRLGLIGSFQNWFADPALAMPAIVAAVIWRGFPFHMLTLLAGLQTIPVDVIEASKIDGAGTIQRFRYITLAHMRYVILATLLISMIWLNQHFITVWVLTAGGPGDATETLAVHVYRAAFESWDLGTASAMGLFWLLAMMVIAGLSIYSTTRRYEST